MQFLFCVNNYVYSNGMFCMYRMGQKMTPKICPIKWCHILYPAIVYRYMGHKWHQNLSCQMVSYFLNGPKTTKKFIMSNGVIFYIPPCINIGQKWHRHLSREMVSYFMDVMRKFIHVFISYSNIKWRITLPYVIPNVFLFFTWTIQLFSYFTFTVRCLFIRIT